MAEHQFSLHAVEDLTDIWTYTVEVWSERQADRYYDLLVETCGELAERPSLGRKFAGATENFLGFPVGRHVIFYTIVSPEEIVIVRILHENMDFERQLEED